MFKHRLHYISLAVCIGLTFLLTSCGGDIGTSQPTEATPTPIPTPIPTHTPAPSPKKTDPIQSPLPPKLSLQETITVNSKGMAVVTNASDVTVVVNKKRNLPEDYVPKDLVEPNIPFSFKEKNERRLMRPEAAKALEELFQKAKKDNIALFGISAYRSYASQKSLFAYYVKAQGEQEARRFSAQPGQSEHQTGLAIDVSSPSVKLALEETFGNSLEGKWLAQNAAEFGFIIRYPKGKEDMTGYAYEPWHIRYVGKAIAQEITQKGITLEQYFEDAVPVSKP